MPPHSSPHSRLSPALLDCPVSLAPPPHSRSELVTPAVGGIYTVIKTKAPVTCAEYGDRYTLMGPLSYKSAPMEVEAIEWDKPTPVNEGQSESLVSSREGWPGGQGSFVRQISWRRSD